MSDEEFDEAIEHLISLGLVEEVVVNGEIGYCLAGDDQAKANHLKEHERLN